MIRAYIRVSDRSQVEKFGPAAQKETINNWSASNYPGERIEWYVEEGVSGTIPFEDRQESARLLYDIQENDIIICAFASRLSRKLWITAKLFDDIADKGAIICLPEMGEVTAENKPMFYFRAYEAEAERVSILKNTHNGREQKRKEGGYIGGKPQPWQRYNKETKELEDDPDGLEEVRHVHECVLSEMRQIDIVKSFEMRGSPKSKQLISRWVKLMKDPNSEMSIKLRPSSPDASTK